MRRMLPMLCTLALVAISTPAQTAPEPSAQAVSTTLRIKAVLHGPRTVVFTTPEDSCISADIPDAMARAFRDSTGTVHFIKLRVTEYHGWSHPGECHQQNPNNFFFFEDDSDTYHLSKDGGYHYESFAAPQNLVAGVPVKYQIDNRITGYSVDFNIVSYGGWYYAIATDWQWPRNCSGKTGAGVPLPIAAKNPLDAHLRNSLLFIGYVSLLTCSLSFSTFLR